ncbi:MAG: glycogen synthase GlgA [Clostridia bacterium]|jgi:starch synthase|nr:glycogen synthase GlgA [Clostridia bacterium]MCI2015973.1 glycogen synthase GlgA [Clostridia bacterium]
MDTNKPIKVLIISSEVAPYAKSGGLGDVTGSLPVALRKNGVDVRVVMPKYKSIKNEYFIGCKYLGSYETHLSWRKQPAGIIQKDGDFTTYFIENNYYFGRDKYYGYDDDNERFAFFCKAALEILQFIDFIPDVIHCNDWQTGPLCLLLKEYFNKFADYKNIKTLFTIHNMQYQGIFPRYTLEMLEISDWCFDSVEFYGSMSFMKAGLMYSDMISTVSSTYAKEIKTFQYGYGLDGVMRSRADKLCGILNGIDYEKNNPETDKRIYVNFSIDSIEKKKQNKLELQKQLGLNQKDVPMISIVSRLAEQKGLDLVSWVAEEILNRDIQLVLLGTGEKRLEDFFRDLAYRYPDKISTNILFDDTLAQRIYASSDMFLMPSLFEPCGLGQMFSLRYGTIPIVRKTGGLSDTVTHFDRNTKQGNGFVFEHYTSDGLLWAINEALSVYYSDDWKYVVKNAMESDFSWNTSAKKYIELYKKIINCD